MSKKNLEKLRDKSERTSWNIPFGPTTVNGFYKPETNQICKYIVKKNSQTEY
jgi:predicted metalloendopeptidase